MRAAARGTVWAAAAALATSACRGPSAVGVSMSFGNSWTIAGERLTADEQRSVRDAAVRTLHEAFAGFDVEIVEAERGAPHKILVEDTPYSAPMYFSGVGVTLPTTTVSSVRADGLLGAELSVIGCESVTRCGAKTRQELLIGLGVGIGATAAHELGHQRGLDFTRHAACDDCYDSARSTSYTHFFGRKRWSGEALRIMRLRLRAVPPRVQPSS